LAQTDKYCKAVKNVKDIVIGELGFAHRHLTPPERRPAIGQWAIMEWQMTVAADNLRELLPPLYKGAFDSVIEYQICATHSLPAGDSPSMLISALLVVSAADCSH
jgi:hypothetical protein